MLFGQSGEVIAGTDGVTHTGVTCFRCELKGHYADECPNGPNATLLQSEAAAAVTLLQASHTEVVVAGDDTANKEVSDFTFTQLPSRHELIPSSWVLLDSQSTVSVFKNSNFLTNVRRSNSQLNVHTNDGTQISNVIHYSFVSTVANNKAQFPRREIEGADKARALYRKIGRPSQHQFEQILAKNLIRNCPVTVDDAKRALLIYGPNVAAL
jgi:hypothetical protein